MPAPLHKKLRALWSYAGGDHWGLCTEAEADCQLFSGRGGELDPTIHTARPQQALRIGMFDRAFHKASISTCSTISPVSMMATRLHCEIGIALQDRQSGRRILDLRQGSRQPMRIGVRE
ncbi:hypothetical protein NXC14_PC00421 (plasmid) [Rhizobium sp. NXC14]|nr:hypothetical protein NXC14_PC00421 [Rhizobium sp. NXC14]